MRRRQRQSQQQFLFDQPDHIQIMTCMNRVEIIFFQPFVRQRFAPGNQQQTGVRLYQTLDVAKTTLTQVTVGLQLGGQKYRELILFQDKAALDKFLEGKFTMAAQVSAVAAASGAAANAKYANGVKVITMAVGGLMYEASVGGQKFGIEKY